MSFEVFHVQSSVGVGVSLKRKNNDVLFMRYGKLVKLHFKLHF